MYSPVPELNALKSAEPAFVQLRDFDDSSLLADFPYRDKVIPFAVRDDLVYAIWRVDNGQHLQFLPIVSFGPAGPSLVAERFVDFARVVAGWGGEAGAQWLRAEYRMLPAADPAPAAAAAEKRYGVRFRKFLAGEPLIYSPIPILNDLKDLYDSTRDCIAEGFELYDYDDKEYFFAEEELGDPEFLSRLIPFAQANGSGSMYAIWRSGDETDLALLPVVAFGDEGGAQVVARDFQDFLRLLGYDAEIMVEEDSAHYSRQENDDHSGSHEQFVEWLQERGLAPAEDPDAVVAAAQEVYGERFRAWITPFYEQIGWV